MHDDDVRRHDGIDKVRIRAQYLGIPGPDEGNGPCVLPHHDHPAGLIKGKLGWAYYCELCDEAFTLPAVLAIQRYAKVPYGDRREESCKRPGWRDIRRPGRIEVMRWADHLDYLVDLKEAKQVEIFLPDDLSESAMRLGSAIKLMLGLRDPKKWPENQDEFTCTRRYSRVMADLSDDGAKFARQELERRKVIVRVGKTGFAIVFRVGRAEEVYPSGEPADDEVDAENALLEKFIEEFDATEITDEDEA